MERVKEGKKGRNKKTEKRRKKKKRRERKKKKGKKKKEERYENVTYPNELVLFLYTKRIHRENEFHPKKKLVKRY